MDDRTDSVLNEVALSQRMISHFPYGAFNSDEIALWLNCSGGYLEEAITKMLSRRPEGIVLRRLSVKDILTIPASDGKMTFAKNNEAGLLSFHVDLGCSEWDECQTVTPTVEMSADVREMAEDASFLSMLEFLFEYPEDEGLFFTESQILLFVEKYPLWLHPDGNATFFPLKVGRLRFVVSVKDVGGILHFRIRKFDCVRVWSAEQKRRFVFPWDNRWSE